jgi:hypothetical protein
MPHKKGHTWKDAFGGKLINKAKLAVSKKVKEIDASDSSLHNKIKNRKITQNIEKGNAAGRIQKKLTKAGFTKTELRKKGEKTKAFGDNRKKMQEMKKSNPEKYKKIKREQLKKEREKAFRAGSHTWD